MRSVSLFLINTAIKYDSDKCEMDINLKLYQCEHKTVE